MTNTEIIIAEAVSNNIFTKEEVNIFLEAGVTIPLHTYEGWRRLGYQVKASEHAVVKTRLWKPKSRKALEEAEGGEGEDGFYLTKAYLFSDEQVEKIQDGGIEK